MVKTTLYIEEDTARELKQVARIEQRSQAEVVRRALAEYTARVLRPEPLGVGAYRSGRSDVSARAEEILRRSVRREP